ncbi:MAG: putative sugar nucleotidyl transferase [Ignavibacteriales bacterium]|nr:putative sugar nucleotidyl transferase [Ignavibacteriales bacterium]
MKTALCIFEDEGFRNFLPLTYTRPVYDLRCGILTIREKIAARFSMYELVLHTRDYLKNIVKEQNQKIAVNEFTAPNILFVNGRLLAGITSVTQIKKMKDNSILLAKDGSVITAKLSGNYLKKLIENKKEFLPFHILENINKIETDLDLIKYTWELVNINGVEINNDYDLLVKKIQKIEARKFPSVEFKNKKKIFINKDSAIDPFVFIDASDGQVYIGKHVHIMSHTYIQGPVYIGDNSIIKSGASIYHNTSIGEVCRVGGEVESSIIQSYSNKQHEGFLGHSYLGSWINIGASTNNSDLKNNYDNISVLLNGKPVDTGSKFIGLMMGDHSKTAINTMFNTGTIVGVACNIFGSGFPPRYIPSFSWGGSDFLKTNDLNKTVETAKIVLQRRKLNLTLNGEDLLRKVFDLTTEERLLKLKS